MVDVSKIRTDWEDVSEADWQVNSARAQANKITAEPLNALGLGVIEALSQSGTSAGLEMYTGPTPLYLDPNAPLGTARQFFVAASGTIDGVAVATDETATFVKLSTGWHHYPATTGVPTPPNNDTIPPSAPTNLQTSVTTTSITLTWDAAVDNYAIAHYEVRRSGDPTIINVLASTESYYPREHTFTGLAVDTSYTLEIRAVDIGGNESPWVSTVRSTAPLVDTTPPSAPTNLAASPGLTAMTLTWTAATDDTGVTAYRVSSDNGATWVTQSVTGLTYQVTGLTADTSYTFAVQARDAAGNWGTSATVVASTLAALVRGGFEGDDYTTGQDFDQVPNTTIGVAKPWETYEGAFLGNFKWYTPNIIRQFYLANKGTVVFDWGASDAIVTGRMQKANAAAGPQIVLRYADASNFIKLWVDSSSVLHAEQTVGGTTSVIAGINGQATSVAGDHNIVATLNGTSLSVIASPDGTGTPFTGTVSSSLVSTKYGLRGATNTPGEGSPGWIHLYVDPLP